MELPNVVEGSTCQLWAAPVTAKVAVGIGEPVGRRRSVPLHRPRAAGRRARAAPRRAFGVPDLERGRPAGGLVQRAADRARPRARRRRRRRLDAAPPLTRPTARSSTREATGSSSRIARASRRRATITNVHYGSDGSVAVVVEGRRIERYVDGDADRRARPPGALPGPPAHALAGQLLRGVPRRRPDQDPRRRLLAPRPERHRLPGPRRRLVAGRRVDRDRRRRPRSPSTT